MKPRAMRPSTRERYSGRALTRISIKEVYVLTRLESMVIHDRRTMASMSAMCVRSRRETTCIRAWSHRRSCGIGEGEGASRADFLTLNWSTSESYGSRLPYHACQSMNGVGGQTYEGFLLQGVVHKCEVHVLPESLILLYSGVCSDGARWTVEQDGRG